MKMRKIGIMMVTVSVFVIGIVYKRDLLFDALSTLVHGNKVEQVASTRLPEDIVKHAAEALRDCVVAEDEMYDAARLEELAQEKYPDQSYSLVLLEENMQQKRGDLTRARLSLQQADELCVHDKEKYAQLKEDIGQMLHTVDEFDRMFTSMIEIIKVHPDYVHQRQQYGDNHRAG